MRIASRQLSSFTSDTLHPRSTVKSNDHGAQEGNEKRPRRRAPPRDPRGRGFRDDDRQERPGEARGRAQDRYRARVRPRTGDRSSSNRPRASSPSRAAPRASYDASGTPSRRAIHAIHPLASSEYSIAALTFHFEPPASLSLSAQVEKYLTAKQSKGYVRVRARIPSPSRPARRRRLRRRRAVFVGRRIGRFNQHDSRKRETTNNSFDTQSTR